MNFSSEGSPNATICQQLLHNDVSDSGVDLSEPNVTNSGQTFLPSPNSQHTIIGRSHSANLTSTNGQDNQNNHAFVIKTSSSPTPEQSIPTRSSFVPLSAVLSAPAQSIHSYNSEFHHQNFGYHQQIKPTLTISDEDEEDFNLSSNQLQPADNTNRLRQFSSLRTKNPKQNMNNQGNNSSSVSPYLCIDGDSGSVRNTFIQSNSGMRGKQKKTSIRNIFLII